MKIKISDIDRSTVLEGLYDWDYVSIRKITEKKLPDSYCYVFSRYLDDFDIENDIVNTEDIGYLTMRVRRDIPSSDIVNAINMTLKEMKL